MRFWRTPTYFSQIWRRVTLILIVTQLIFVMVLLVISLHVATRLGENVSTLLGVVDVVFAQSDPDLIKQVA
jgi:hypothetical protein